MEIITGDFGKSKGKKTIVDSLAQDVIPTLDPTHTGSFLLITEATIDEDTGETRISISSNYEVPELMYTLDLFKFNMMVGGI